MGGPQIKNSNEVFLKKKTPLNKHPPLPGISTTLNGSVHYCESKRSCLSMAGLQLMAMLLFQVQPNQSYTATANGNYAVIVTLNGCPDTSICVK